MFGGEQGPGGPKVLRGFLFLGMGVLLWPLRAVLAISSLLAPISYFQFMLFGLHLFSGAAELDSKAKPPSLKIKMDIWLACWRFAAAFAGRVFWCSRGAHPCAIPGVRDFRSHPMVRLSRQEKGAFVFLQGSELLDNDYD